MLQVPAERTQGIVGCLLVPLQQKGTPDATFAKENKMGSVQAPFPTSSLTVCSFQAPFVLAKTDSRPVWA